MSAILTYHSVGAHKNGYISRLPSVEEGEFIRQLTFLKKNYSLPSVDEFFHSSSDQNVLLTFDDGLRCHHDIVTPILRDMDIPAIFFVSSGPLMHGEMLLVHQLQILISESKVNPSLFNELFNFATNHCGSMVDLQDKNKRLHIHKYESQDYNFIKKSFQIFIDLDIGKTFSTDLLIRYCDYNETFFSDVYINLDECKEMIDDGFKIGGHSKNHLWMEYISRKEVVDEVRSDCALFELLGIEREYYCYPYGSYSKDCIDIVRDSGFQYGFTIEPGNFENKIFDPYQIKRYDVNEFFENG